MELFKKKKPQSKEGRAKPFRFELGWRGMFGVVIVCFCLFFWMFLLGIWAGQTILLPLQDKVMAQPGGMSKQHSAKEGAEIILPGKPLRSN